MTITTFSSREFNQDRGRASKAAIDGPVFITNRGKPSYVLMSYDEYRRITDGKRSLLDVLSMPGLSDIDLDSVLPQFRDKPKPVEFD